MKCKVLLQVRVKHIWQLVAESLIIEPWTDEEFAKGEAAGKAW